MEERHLQMHKEVKTPASVEEELTEHLINISPDKATSLLCKMCLVAKAKYTCPRCNLLYCSVSCYQSEKHVGCSEAFYKDWVVEELKEMTQKPEDRHKVLDMLNKDLEERAQEDSNEESDDDLASRLTGLDLDQDISTVWGRLTHKEKEDFAKMLQDGRLAKLIEIWTPWWRLKTNNKLVTDPKSNEEEMPNIIADIPDVNMLLKNKQPSSDVRFDLINILFAYSFVTRIHNGCHFECPMDSTQDLFESCTVLQDQLTCSSTGEAIQKGLDCLYKKNKSENSSHEFYLTLLEDVKMLVSGPGTVHSLTFMSSALSDLILLLKTSMTVVKKELKSQEASEDLNSFKSKLFKSEKKLTFLLSWLQRYGMGVHKLLPLIQFELETRQSEFEDMKQVKSMVEANFDVLKSPAEPHMQGNKIVELT
ncbi:unnamed protein product [Lymnaea stagnalis]|uniref:HIT-type domain-containing protein n=1 Tax=Lymnaea stagnalis TaxID=6523 RepID=A0AAV2IG80_LYMST